MEKEQDNLTALLLSAKKAAKMLGIGRSLFYQMNSSGSLGPQAVRLGRRNLWRRLELVSWVEAGCPPRNQWLSRNGKI